MSRPSGWLGHVLVQDPEVKEPLGVKGWGWGMSEPRLVSGVSRDGFRVNRTVSVVSRSRLLVNVLIPFFLSTEGPGRPSS